VKDSIHKISEQQLLIPQYHKPSLCSYQRNFMGADQLSFSPLKSDGNVLKATISL